MSQAILARFAGGQIRVRYSGNQPYGKGFPGEGDTHSWTKLQKLPDGSYQVQLSKDNTLTGQLEFDEME